MANTRVTKREILALIKAAMADNATVVAYCDNETALLDKKNEYRKSRPTKPTKAQEQAIALKPDVLEAVRANPASSSKTIADTLDVSFQKVTPILKALIEEGAITSETVKGKTLYTVIGEA